MIPMRQRFMNRITFALERFILRGLHFRLLFIAIMLVAISLLAGALVFKITGQFQSVNHASWWAFLRLTDPGYLGDDEGTALRVISTLVTILGYVLFMGALIAIMTQWLHHTINKLELGLTAIVRKNHIVILRWTNRTAAIVKELLVSEGRVHRFLKRHGARNLHVVILTESLNAERRHELQVYLGKDWDEQQVTFRSGTPLNPEHLARVNFLSASAVIMPGADFIGGGVDNADMLSIKAILDMKRQIELSGSDHTPLLVTEIFDARKSLVAQSTYPGKIEVLASDAIISRLIAQNIRHHGVSHIFDELLSHDEDNEVYIRKFSQSAGATIEQMHCAFPEAILIGILRNIAGADTALLNPSGDLVIEAGDRFVLIAKDYDKAFLEDNWGSFPLSIEGPRIKQQPVLKKKINVLLLGWNEKVPALIQEFDRYEHESFNIDIFSAIPIHEREARLSRFALQTKRVTLNQLDGDYCSPSDLAQIISNQYDSIAILGCDWLQSKEQADARTVTGYLLLKQLLGPQQKQSDILVELLSSDDDILFESGNEGVIVSPMVLSHMLAHVTLRPELNQVFTELFRVGGTEIYFQPKSVYSFPEGAMSFADIQLAARKNNQIALGVRSREALADKPGYIKLNPPKESVWNLDANDEIIVLASAEY